MNFFYIVSRFDNFFPETTQETVDIKHTILKAVLWLKKDLGGLKLLIFQIAHFSKKKTYLKMLF